MLIAGVAAFCVLILLLAFLVPRLSRHPERGGQKILGTGGRAAGKAPGKVGRFARKPFDTDYGSRDFTVRDPEGNLWSFGTYRGAPR